MGVETTDFELGHPVQAALSPSHALHFHELYSSNPPKYLPNGKPGRLWTRHTLMDTHFTPPEGASASTAVHYYQQCHLWTAACAHIYLNILLHFALLVSYK